MMIENKRLNVAVMSQSLARNMPLVDEKKRVRRCTLRIRTLGLAAGLLLLTAGLAHADGVDPVINMGGGHGSMPCDNDGTGFVGTTGTGGAFTIMCDNNTGGIVTSFTFNIDPTNAPGGVSATLDNLLAPFANNPLLSNLDWTVSCVDGASVDTCTATKSQYVTQNESLICNLEGLGALCSQLSTLSAVNNSALCYNPLIYVVFGILPGCDQTAGGTAGTAAGDFADNAPAGLTPAGDTLPSVPEPGSLAMMLMGLSGLPLLRRRFVR